MSAALTLAACNGATASKPGPALALAQTDRPVTLSAAADPGRYKIGKPYKIAGRWYTPHEDPDYDATGRASWYGRKFHGRSTANGEVFDMAGLSGAHPTLPLPSYARVTNLQNGRSVVVRINDRGPYAHNRLIDVSARTAEVLGFKRDGSADVRVQFVGLAPADGDDAWLTTTVRNDGQAVAPTMVAALGPAPGTDVSLPGVQSAGGSPDVGWVQADRAPQIPQPPSLSLVSGYRGGAGRTVLDAAFALFR